MKKSIALLVPVFIVVTAFSLADEKGKIVTAVDFQKQADSLGFIFSMPPNYVADSVRVNRDLYYCFAMKDTSADFEVRYSIWSLKSALVEYDRCKADPKCSSIHPDKLIYGRVQSNVLNMTAGASMDYSPFGTRAVGNEFNADAGGSSFFEFNCEFGKGYKYGQAMYLHKDSIADVIITFMSNDRETHSDLMLKSFYALKFK
jgi:hypothetical protein